MFYNGTSTSRAVLCQAKENMSFWHIDSTLTGTTTSCQSGPGSLANEQLHYIPKSSRIGAS